MTLLSRHAGDRRFLRRKFPKKQPFSPAMRHLDFLERRPDRVTLSWLEMRLQKEPAR
jgi:hypothetical protein